MLGHYSKADINSPTFDVALSIHNSAKKKSKMLNVEEEILMF